MAEKGFDADRYLESQKKIFNQVLTDAGKDPVFIEFGGKPFTDHHAERVLPGYDAECKAEILRETVKLADVVMVVNARDIVAKPDGRKNPSRIRGDSGLMYDKEAMRLIENAHKQGIPLDKLVLASTPTKMNNENKKKIDIFQDQLRKMGVKMLTHYFIENYPNSDILSNSENFEQNNKIRVNEGNLVVISPGGGSGKFSVLLSEMYTSLMSGERPKYIKFETFPIYQLEADHALNLAFEAATADLGNRVLDIRKDADIKGGRFRTSYDKDLENFILLKQMFAMFGKQEALAHMDDAVDMGINRVVDGIADMKVVIDACRQEIIRRIARYDIEVKDGIEEVQTLEVAKDILGRFDGIYQIRTSGK